MQRCLWYSCLSTGMTGKMYVLTCLLWLLNPSCAIFCAVVLSPLPVLLCTAVLPVKFWSCGALGFAAQVSSPHPVLYRYTLRPWNLRYASGGEKSTTAKATWGGISVWCAKYFSGKCEEEEYGKRISSLLNYWTDAGCLWSKENKKLMGRRAFSKTAEHGLLQFCFETIDARFYDCVWKLCDF